jgi:GNAT superfamily N-acetyltransferase
LLIRPLDEGDYGAVREFDCRVPGAKWTRDVHSEIRNRLIDEYENPDRRLEIAAGVDDHSGALLGLVAYEPEDDQVGTWAIPVLAVHKDHHRKGYGLQLKSHALVDCATKGASRVVSQVHYKNERMLKMNTEHFGAGIELDPYDPKLRLAVVRFA